MYDNYGTSRTFLLSLFALLVLTTGCVSRRNQVVKHRPPVSTRPESRPTLMPVDEILDMTERKLPAHEIIEKMDQRQAIFDLSVEKILMLREAGVSDKVINEMLARPSSR